MLGYYLLNGKKARVILTKKKTRTFYELGLIGDVGKNNLFCEISEQEIKRLIKDEKLIKL